MSCSNNWCSRCCSNSCSCGCAGKPYYSESPVCPEDSCQKIYENRFYFAVCPTVGWNVPLCGATALLSVPGVQGASIGSYIWHINYGFFQISSIDTDKGLLGITNTCTAGNATPGTQIAACTCFIITSNPIDVPGAASLFPYLALDFTAPADGNCVDITVTNINGLASGDVISIGTGLYTIDSFGSDTVVRICNTGDGILPGTPVIAKDDFGNFVYPINVVSNCCEALIPRLDALDVDVINLLGSGGVWGSTSAGTANAQTIAVDSDLVQVDGTVLRFIAGFTTTSTTPTLNVNGDGALTILDKAGKALLIGDITVGDLVVVVAYNSNYRLMSSTGARMLLRNTTAAAVSNSVVLTTFSTTVIPAGYLSPGKFIKFTALGRLRNASGGNVEFDIVNDFGGAAVHTNVLILATATDVYFKYEVIMGGITLATQIQSVLFTHGAALATSSASAAVNCAVAQNFRFQGEMNTADATAIIDVYYQNIEYI